MPEVDEQLWTVTVGDGGNTVYTVGVQAGPQCSFENDGSSVTLPVFVKWGDHLELLDQAKRDFLGYPEIKPGQNQSFYLARHTPAVATPFATSQKAPYLYATKMTAKGHGMPPHINPNEGIHDPSTDWPRYRWAACDVTFETLTYDVLTDDIMVLRGFADSNGNPDEAMLQRYCTKVVRPGMEYLTLPPGGFKYVGPTAGGKPVDVQGGPGRLTPNYDLSVTWHLVPLECVGTAALNPQLDEPPIDNCLGTVNSLPFPAFPDTAPAGVMTVNVASPGGNYKVGDVLSVLGGTPIIRAMLQVVAVSGSGGVTVAVPLTRGVYGPTGKPPNPAGVGNASGGTGSGATFNLTFGAGFPPGTLLLTGAEIRPVRSTAGDRLYDIEYRWKYLAFGIQKLYYQGSASDNPPYSGAGYFEVSSNGTTNIGPGLFNSDPAAPPVNIYPWADHQTLFRVPYSSYRAVTGKD
jgi:hypothetical protein